MLQCSKNFCFTHNKIIVHCIYFESQNNIRGCCHDAEEVWVQISTPFFHTMQQSVTTMGQVVNMCIDIIMIIRTIV